MLKVLLFFILATSSLVLSAKLTRSFSHPLSRENQYSVGYGIVNGQEAAECQFPYQVGIYVYHSDSRSDFCGGSLITDNYILTAAHCLDDIVSATVILGALNIFDTTETNQIRLSVNSSSFKVHESWDITNLVNDIALIKLPQSVETNCAIATIPIASGGSTFANVIGTVSGWGLTSSDDSTVTPVLRYLNSTIMTNEDCKAFNANYAAVIQDTHLCLSGANYVGTCSGDSGGPLTVIGGQVGIVSFGSNNCESGAPSVFTRVSEYYTWIENNID